MRPTNIKIVATAALAAGALAASAATLARTAHSGGARVAAPEMIELAPGTFRHRAAGDYTRGNAPVAAPLVEVHIERMQIMKRQVSAGDYRRCVAAGACAPTDSEDADRPAVQVSWRDASAYAAWLSHETGRDFRLPTDAEWAYAAAERFTDDALPAALASSDPGRRALARYAVETRETVPPQPQPIGAFGSNTKGLTDIAGNVWEWTNSCFEGGALDADGRPTGAITVNCGIRVVEGRHRTYMADFIRDARAGGCAADLPPANLGFRLVRDDTARAGAPIGARWLSKLVGR
jgi:formylglycine-generating enzyme required for sulfatase activity